MMLPSVGRVEIGDLERAKQKLREGRMTLVFVKNSKLIYETETEGLHGFLQAIEKLDEGLSGAVVADKVIGRAAAFLCVHSHIAAAFAVTLSQSGSEVLKANRIFFEFENLVPTILNFKKDDMCPFEKLVESATNSEEAFERIKQRCRELAQLPMTGKTESE